MRDKKKRNGLKKVAAQILVLPFTVSKKNNPASSSLTSTDTLRVVIASSSLMGFQGSLYQWLPAFGKDTQGRSSAREMSPIRRPATFIRRKRGRANLILYLLFRPDSESRAAFVRLEHNIRGCQWLPGNDAVVAQVSSNKAENLRGRKISKEARLENTRPCPLKVCLIGAWEKIPFSMKNLQGLKGSPQRSGENTSYCSEPSRMHRAK